MPKFYVPPAASSSVADGRIPSSRLDLQSLGLKVRLDELSVVAIAIGDATEAEASKIVFGMVAPADIRDHDLRVFYSVAHDLRKRGLPCECGQVLHELIGEGGRRRIDGDAIDVRKEINAELETLQERGRPCLDLPDSVREFVDGYIADRTLLEEAESDGAGPTADFVADPSPALDAAAYHGLAGEIAKRHCRHKDLSMAAFLIQLLVGFGNLVSRRYYFKVNDTRHFAVINVVVVGPSSAGGKGDSAEAALMFLDKIDRNHHWRRTENVQSGQAIVSLVRDDKLDAKGNKVLGIVDKRRLVVAEEFNSLLAMADLRGSTITQLVRQLFDCRKTVKIEGKHFPDQATDGRISIIGHATPTDLHADLSKKDMVNGFGNRFMWIWCSRPARRPKPPADGEEDLSREIEGLREAYFFGDPGTDEFAEVPVEIKFAPDAEALFDSRTPELEAPAAGRLGELLARGKPFVRRMAMIYAILDQEGEIRPPHIEAAFAVWDYAVASARHVFGEHLGDQKLNAVLAAVKQAGPDGIKAGDITAQVLNNNGAATPYIDKLLSARLVHVKKVGKTTLVRYGREAY